MYHLVRHYQDFENQNERKTRTFSKLMVVIIIVGILGTIFSSFNDHQYIATVTDKERVVKNKDAGVESYYLIFCKDDEGNYYEFKNEDFFIRRKFRSSSVYNQLEIGETYKFTVVGFRVGLFSWYENIIKFEKVD